MTRVLVWLLCLTLSAPAWAGWLTAGACCPSQRDDAPSAAQAVDRAQAVDGAQALQAAHEPAEPAEPALPDCCNDMDSFLLSGQTCKTGLGVSVPLLGAPCGLPLLIVETKGQPPLSAPALAPPSAEPEGIWRPPL